MKKTILVYFSEDFILSIDMNESNTTKDLVDEVKKQAKEMNLANNENIIALKSRDSNDVLDSYLLMQSMNLERIRDGELLLPVFREKVAKNKKQVSINDLEFLKCIGKGGSSEVYLGKATSSPHPQFPEPGFPNLFSERLALF